MTIFPVDQVNIRPIEQSNFELLRVEEDILSNLCSHIFTY